MQSYNIVSLLVFLLLAIIWKKSDPVNVGIKIVLWLMAIWAFLVVINKPLVIIL
jgi:hypothetical protein